MEITLGVRNTSKVVLEMRSIGAKVVETARKTMHRAAARIEKRAKLFAPVDKHNLEEAIHIEQGYGTSGRLQMDVVASGEVNGVNVEEYAELVHENYDAPGMMPGPGTLAKREANPGVYIGRKYLERAGSVEERILQPNMIAAVTKTINTGVEDTSDELDADEFDGDGESE